jgi:uncharacterized membrane protein YbhN (UPF0104 family)
VKVRHGLVVFGLVVTLVFGYLAVRDVHAADAWEAARESNYWYVVPALLLLAVAVVMRALRWQSLFVGGKRPPLPDVLSALLVGYLFNNLLPARAGEAARVLALARTSGRSRAEGFGTIIVERAFDMLVLLVMLFLISPWLPEVSWLAAATVFSGLLAVGLGTTIVLVARYGVRPLRLLFRPLGRLFPEQRVFEWAENLTSGLVGLHDPATALIALSWTAASWLVLAASSWVLLLGFDIDLSAGDAALAALLVVIATNLAMVLPSSPGAVGVFEAATIAALGVWDVPRSSALSYALVLHAVNFFPYLIAGAVVLRRYATPLRPRMTEL